MKTNWRLIFLFYWLCIPFSYSASLSIEGTYQGKNLYIQNPENEDGFGFCVSKVMINGDILPVGIASSAFEINFKLFNLAIGDPLFIVIEHSNNCAPKILNPEVLLPGSTYEVVSMKISNKGKLEWTTRNEKGKLPFFIEQYRWDKWVQVGEVRGVGTSMENSYEFMVSPHSGINKVRVVQVDHSGTKNASGTVSFKSDTPEVIKSTTIVKSRIEFTANHQPVETRYEIYDAYGNIVKKGVGSVVDCENLVKGAYYINYDNKTEKFFRS